MVNLGILGSTNGTDLPAIVKSIKIGELSGLAKIAVVISNKESSGILKKARHFKLENYFLPQEDLNRSDYDKKISEILDAFHVNLIALIGYMRFLSPEFVNKYPNKIMNIHPSLLPSFPGMDLNVHQAVLDYGCRVSGCTLFFVDEGKDTGPIILQKAVPVYQKDDANSLKSRVQLAEQAVYIQGIKLYSLGKLKVEGRKVIIQT